MSYVVLAYASDARPPGAYGAESAKQSPVARRPNIVVTSRPAAHARQGRCGGGRWPRSPSWQLGCHTGSQSRGSSSQTCPGYTFFADTPACQSALSTAADMSQHAGRRRPLFSHQETAPSKTVLPPRGGPGYVFAAGAATFLFRPSPARARRVHALPASMCARRLAHREGEGMGRWKAFHGCGQPTGVKRKPRQGSDRTAASQGIP
jgi:hypothetical protein